jgi:hypothetical protein
MARFEVLGLNSDRELIRTLARRLAGQTADASRVRNALRSTIADEPAQKGGILNALRRSPLVGADLNIVRSTSDHRKVRL